MDRTKSIERTSTHDQTAHQTRSDEQVRVETHDTLGQSEILLSLPDQLMGDSDTASVNRKAPKRDVRTIGNRLNNLGNRLYLVGHGPPSRLTDILDDVSNGIWDPRRFEAFRIDANDSDIAVRHFVAALIIHDFEIITDGLLAFELRRQPHPNRVPVANPFGKLCKDFDARHPDVIHLKHRLPWLSSAAK
jgi:hypothetical protein